MAQVAGTRFLDPNILSKIANLELIAKFVVEGFISGLHKSPYHGFSVEFSQYRPYMPGDDIKYIDWKVFARSDRYYIKQFEEETNLCCYIFLDISASMQYSSNQISQISKLEYGCFLAASLAYFMTKQRDAIGFVSFDDSIADFFPAKSNPAHLHRILIALENLKIGKRTDLSAPTHEVAERLKKRGLIVMISDLFDDVASTMKALKHLRYSGHEIILFQILDHQELHFEFDRFTRFVDIETGKEILTLPKAIRKDYLNRLKVFIDEYKIECHREGIDYNLLDTSIPLDLALMSYLAKRQGMT